MHHVSQASRHLLFLDADDLLEPEMLDTVIRHLDEHRDVGMVHVGWAYVDEVGRRVELDAPRLLPRWAPAGPWIRELRDDELETPFASIFCAAGMTPSMSVFRRTAFEQAGAWDEAFGEPAGDTYLSLRVALIAKVHFLSRPLVGYRIHATQMTSDRGRLGEQWRRLEALWADCDHLPEEQRRTVEQAWRFKERAFVLRNGLHHAVRETRAGNVGRAVRYSGGAVRIALRSLLRGPPPRRR
jgi:hypothetical protein